PVMLDYRRRWPQPAVGVDWEDAYAAACVICHQHVSPAVVDTHMTGVCAVGVLVIDRRQSARLWIDCECADRAAWLALVLLELLDRVEVAALAIDRHK